MNMKRDLAKKSKARLSHQALTYDFFDLRP